MTIAWGLCKKCGKDKYGCGWISQYLCEDCSNTIEEERVAKRNKYIDTLKNDILKVLGNGKFKPSDIQKKMVSLGHWPGDVKNAIYHLHKDGEIETDYSVLISKKEK